MFNVYTIKDDKSGVHSPPILGKSLPEVMRSIILAIREGKQNFAVFPADFSLWLIAEYDETLGGFVELQKNHVLNIIDLVEQKGPQ